jgi:hypothetical protein
MPPPEQLARQQIDTMLLDAGWTIQNFRELDLTAKRLLSARFLSNLADAITSS